MTALKKVLVATIAVMLASSGAGAILSARGSAQTMYPRIWGLSNLGETCSGYCYGSPTGLQYFCCGVTQPPK